MRICLITIFFQNRVCCSVIFFPVNYRKWLLLLAFCHWLAVRTLQLLLNGQQGIRSQIIFRWLALFHVWCLIEWNCFDNPINNLILGIIPFLLEILLKKTCLLCILWRLFSLSNFRHIILSTWSMDVRLSWKNSCFIIKLGP